MNSKEQALLAQILDLFAETFGKKAVLRGGMVLRLLGSPRYTNDLDYVFVPYRSKNEIVNEILSCLKSIAGATTRHSLNSKCLRVVVEVSGVSVQVEAKVAERMKIDLTSNKQLAAQFNMPPRIIPIVDHSISLAHKLAAWNERRLLRDIYDIWFFLRMNVQPDLELLQKRLKAPCYSSTVKAEDYFTGSSYAEFFDFIRQRVNQITQKDLVAELADYFNSPELVGLALQFKAAFALLGMPTPRREG